MSQWGEKIPTVLAYSVTYFLDYNRVMIAANPHTWIMESGLFFTDREKRRARYEEKRNNLFNAPFY